MADAMLDGLNDEQRSAVLCDSNCMVIAAPGSGKTSMLAKKAARRLRSPNDRVCAVTFTRDSAHELRERIAALTPKAAWPRLLVGTFHSVMLLMAHPQRRVAFGGDILADARSTLGKDSMSLVREGTRRTYIQRAINEAGMGDITVEQATRIIEKLKSGESAREVEHDDLVAAYTSIMQRNGVIDMQDILLNTNKGVREGAISLLPVSDIFIDEFQDTDRTQLEWAEMHGNGGVRITGVGDDDQSIYAFRNALGYAGMNRIIDGLPAQRILMGRNYRSHSEILSVASRLIIHNLSRMPKDLVANKGTGGSVCWKAYKSRDDEAFAATEFARVGLSEGGTAAILARTNRRLDEVEARLSAMGIEYRRAPGDSIAKKVEVVLFATALRALFQPNARFLDELLSWAGVSESDLRGIHRVFKGVLILGEKRDFDQAGISDEGRAAWRKFVTLFKGWQKNVAVGGLELLVVQGVYEWLVSCTSDKQSLRMLGVAKQLFTPALGNREGERPSGTIRDRLEAFQRMEEALRKKEKSGGPAVELMTAHGSKGLEFDRVWILGAEEDVFPSADAALEEERRLMYVAMTRARKYLVLSIGGGKPPSLFIKESGIERHEDATESQVTS